MKHFQVKLIKENNLFPIKHIAILSSNGKNASEPSVTLKQQSIIDKEKNER